MFSCYTGKQQISPSLYYHVIMAVKKNNPGFFISFLIALTALAFLSVDLYLPSLPALTTAFTMSNTLSQLTVSIFLLSFCSSQLFYGPFSDRHGRCFTLKIGLGIYLTGCFLCVFASTGWMLFTGRFIQGLGIGAAATLCRVMARDVYSGVLLSKILSYLNTGVATVLTIAPVVGGFIQQRWGYRGNFIFMLIAGLGIFFALFFYQETNKNLTRQPFAFKKLVAHYYQLLQHKVFIAYIICTSIGISALLAFLIFNPFLIQVQLGYSAATYGVIAFCIGAFEIIGSLVNSYLLKFYTAQQTLFSGICLLAASGLVMLVTGISFKLNLFTVIGTSMGIAFGLGMIAPSTNSLAFSLFDSDIGIAGALYGFLQILITTGISFIAAHLNATNQLSLGIVIVTLSVVGLVAYVFTQKTLIEA